MNIGLAYDLQTDPADPRQAECDPPATLDAVSQALARLGHRVERLGSARQLLAAPGRLRAVELVFNLAEGTQGRCREAWLPMLCELHGVPYVGADPLALMLGLDKVVSKRLACAEGIATPPWLSVDSAAALPHPLPLPFPLIVKPRHEGSGRGIDAGAIVRTPEALAARVAWVIAECGQPALIEAFIDYGELTVLVIGNDPPVAYPAVQRPVDCATRLSCHVAPQPPAAWEAPLILEGALDAAARRAAATLFRALGCRDMARVDFRVARDGALFFLEINPLPSFDPAGTIGLLAEHLGVTYTALIGRVLDAALARLGAAAAPAR